MIKNIEIYTNMRYKTVIEDNKECVYDLLHPEKPPVCRSLRNSKLNPIAPPHPPPHPPHHYNPFLMHGLPHEFPMLVPHSLPERSPMFPRSIGQEQAHDTGPNFDANIVEPDNPLLFLPKPNRSKAVTRKELQDAVDNRRTLTPEEIELVEAVRDSIPVREDLPIASNVKVSDSNRAIDPDPRDDEFTYPSRYTKVSQKDDDTEEIDHERKHSGKYSKLQEIEMQEPSIDRTPLEMTDLRGVRQSRLPRISDAYTPRSRKRSFHESEEEITIEASSIQTTRGYHVLPSADGESMILYKGTPRKTGRNRYAYLKSKLNRLKYTPKLQKKMKGLTRKKNLRELGMSEDAEMVASMSHLSYFKNPQIREVLPNVLKDWRLVDRHSNEMMKTFIDKHGNIATTFRGTKEGVLNMEMPGYDDWNNAQNLLNPKNRIHNRQTRMIDDTLKAIHEEHGRYPDYYGGHSRGGAEVEVAMYRFGGGELGAYTFNGAPTILEDNRKIQRFRTKADAISLPNAYRSTVIPSESGLNIYSDHEHSHFTNINEHVIRPRSLSSRDGSIVVSSSFENEGIQLSELSVPTYDKTPVPTFDNTEERQILEQQIEHVRSEIEVTNPKFEVPRKFGNTRMAGEFGSSLVGAFATDAIIAPFVNDHVSNQYVNAGVRGGIDMGVGNVGARVIANTGARVTSSIASRFLPSVASTAIADQGAVAGTSLIRGGMEGLGIGVVTAPLDLALNNVLNKQLHWNHLESNLASGGVIGTGTIAAMGTLAAAGPETAGLSWVALAVMGLGLGIGEGIGAITGKMQDDSEAKLKASVVSAANHRTDLLKTFPQHNYNFDEALLSYKSTHPDYKDELGVDDDSWTDFAKTAKSQFGVSSTDKTNVNKHVAQNIMIPMNNVDSLKTAITAGLVTQQSEQIVGAAPLPLGGIKIAANEAQLMSVEDNANKREQSEESKKLNKIMTKYVMHNLINRVCTGGAACSDLREKDPGDLSKDDLQYLNDKTANTWKSQADMQVELSYQQAQYTHKRITTAQNTLVDAWNKHQLLPDASTELQRAQKIAELDPTFAARYKNAVKLDAQNRIIEAYKKDQTTIDHMSASIQKAAKYDPHFEHTITTFYHNMNSSASRLEVSVPQLITLQSLDGDAQQNKYLEYTFDRVKTNTQTVKDAKQLSKESISVRKQHFYDIDQAILEDPTSASTWKATDSQILQAHASGMTLTQYQSYITELAKGKSGDFSHLTKYTDAELTDQGKHDRDHLFDELSLRYGKDIGPHMYDYDIHTRLFTRNTAVQPGASTSDYTSKFTPQFLIDARKEYKEMIAKANVENKHQIDDYNKRLLSNINTFADKYNQSVSAQNEYIMSTDNSITNLLHYNVNQAYNENRMTYKPLNNRGLTQKQQLHVDAAKAGQGNIQIQGKTDAQINTDYLNKKVEVSEQRKQSE